MYVGTHASYTYMCTNLWMHTCTNICIQTYTGTHVYAQTCMYIPHTHIGAFVYTNIQSHVYIHKQAYMYMHIHVLLCIPNLHTVPVQIDPNLSPGWPCSGRLQKCPCSCKPCIYCPSISRLDWNSFQHCNSFLIKSKMCWINELIKLHTVWQAI